MKISVVVATYNGEKYIVEQLETIMSQTKRANEVVITDDHSTDNTVLICKNFIENNNLLNWRITTNCGKHGFYSNYCNGLSMITGDLVVLCDQDDIWEENKIQEMSSWFERYDDMLSLASSFSRFFDDEVIVAHQKHKHSVSHDIKKITVNEFLHFPEYLGMSMMISKKLVDYFLNIYDSFPKHSSHDVEMNFLATLNNGFYYIDEVYTRRRSYKESTSHLKKEEFNKYTNPYALQFAKRSADGANYEMMATMSGKLKYISKIKGVCLTYQKRANYIQEKKVFCWLCNLLKLKNYDGFLDYLKDIPRMQLFRKG